MYASRMLAIGILGVMAQLGGPKYGWKGCIHYFISFWTATIAMCLCDVISAPWWQYGGGKFQTVDAHWKDNVSVKWQFGTSRG